MADSQKFLLDISWTSIAKVALAVFVLYLLYLTGELLILVLFAVIISVLFSPAVDFVVAKRVPRSLAVVAIYGFTFGLLGFLIYLAMPVFVYEIREFTQVLPDYFAKFGPSLKLLGLKAFSNFESFSANLEKYLIGISANIFSAIFSIFGGIFSTLFVITVSIFISLERQPVENAVRLLAPPGQKQRALEIWHKAKLKVGGWFLSRLVASLFVGLATYLALAVLNVEFAISLSLLGGLLNLIPYLGPIISGIFIFLLPGLANPMLGFLAFLAFALIQQIENNIMSPVLTRRFVGISPAVTLIAFAIGANLWGILGSILTIPLVAVILDFVRGFLEWRKQGPDAESSEAMPVETKPLADNDETEQSLPL